MDQINPDIAEGLNSYLRSFKIIKTEHLEVLVRLPHSTIILYSGNRGGKTLNVAVQYFLRVLGLHPVAHKNKLARKIRCMSSSLPESADPDEQDNAQYLELKKIIPYELIEKDITARSKNLVVRRPPGLDTLKTVFEFRSSKQELQDLGKIDLSSLWHDEETPQQMREECRVRLGEEHGDEYFSLTATNPYCFDEETEIVTDKGWKRYDEISMSDKLLTYNIGEDCLEWKPIIGFYLSEYHGTMIQMKNKSFDALVTPRHKWIVGNNRRKKKFYLEETEKLNSKNFIKRMTLNIAYKVDNPCYRDEFIALIGWIATGDSEPKSISQEFICSLSERQLKILWDAMIGSQKGAVSFGQAHNKKIVDDFALVGTLLGRIVKVSKVGSKYIARDMSHDRTHIKSLNPEEIQYDGFIWCPSTENETVIARRNGMVSISGNTYTYDIWQEGSFYYRTKTISEMFNLKQIEHVNGLDVACIQMATDDNPILDEESLRIMFEGIDDPDVVANRRYGVPKTVSGRVHKTYNPAIGYIDYRKTFPGGIPDGWIHARGIDYHDSRLPWSVGWMSCSPEDEWFLWQEFHPSIDGPNAYNSYEISKAIIRKSMDHDYMVNLIDPLASAKQPNTLFSVIDDLNRYFSELRAPAYWEGWDTKGTTGRGEIARRFKNANRCGRPFNNKMIEGGREVRLPTLWICNSCPRFHKSIMNWRFGEYITSTTKAINDPKPIPQGKNSHDNMVLECLAKDHRLIHAPYFARNRIHQVARQHRSVTGR